MTTPFDDADDGRFHPPASDDWYWTETGWWAFWVPERGLAGSLYTLFRPHQGVVSSGVHLWDASSDVPWEAVYSRTAWHLPMPDGRDPTDYELANGLRCERLEPWRRYRFTYRDEGRLALDLQFEGLHPPHSVNKMWFDGAERGHIDQPTRVTGTLEVWGEHVDVDCFAIRDRSWHERTELSLQGGPTGYTYCTASPDDGFHLIARDDREDPAEQDIFAGYLCRDGIMADVAEGRRLVLARDRGRVARVRVELVDVLGRRLTAEGDNHLGYAFFGSASVLAWYGLVDWHLDNGVRAWGEDQDCWAPPTEWRAFAHDSR